MLVGKFSLVRSQRMNLSLLIILRLQIWMIHGKGQKRQRRGSMGMGLFSYFYGDTIPNQLREEQIISINKFWGKKSLQKYILSYSTLPDGARDCKFHKFWVWDLESVVNALKHSFTKLDSLFEEVQPCINKGFRDASVSKEGTLWVDEKNTHVIRKLRYKQSFFLFW